RPFDMNRTNGRMARRRVVVTGLGVVSPNGIGTRAFWEACRSGTSGIGRITRFDAHRLPCRVAGEVQNFCAEEYLSEKDLRRLGRSVPLAIAAAREAVCQ